MAATGDTGTDVVPWAVELHGITKRFPGVVANRDIELAVRRGEVHAIVGENGAGKSTLMKTLYGEHRPDEGTIRIDGRELTLRSPSDAIAAGIGMVHQHFMLADNFTVLENIVLGSEPTKGGRLDRAEAGRRIRDISDRYALGLDPDVLVEDLGVGARQRVEIAKVLYRHARILILDEPTAVLVPHEVDELFGNLAELTREGLTVIFISHKLDEVRRVADSITVIRRGTTVGTADPKTTTVRQLAEMMVGAELPSPETRTSTVREKPVLSLAHLTVVTPTGRPLIDDVDLTVREGEVVGIAGVEGNGQAELVDAIMGLRPLAAGTVTFDGGGRGDGGAVGLEDISSWSTRARREAGLGFIPEDRHRQGMLLEAPLWENRILGHQTLPPAAKGLFIDRKAARADTERIMHQYDVRAPSPDTLAVALSGGNQQKLIVGREMSSNPRLLIAAHPTRGVDIGAQSAIWELLKDARAEGMGILLISADLDELIGLSDTLHVMLRGRLVATLDPARVTPEELGGHMTGAHNTAGGSMSFLRRLAPALLPAVFAVVIALIISSAVMAALGVNPFDVFAVMVDFGETPTQQVTAMVVIVNRAIPLFLAGLAVAVAFRMGLFNIGVEGQYRLATIVAAGLGAAVALPGPLHILLIVVVAMAVAAIWAGIVAVLKVTRGVSEVISSIMMNFIALGIASYLLTGPLRGSAEGASIISTAEIPESGQMPALNGVFDALGLANPPRQLYGFLIIAVVVGVFIAVLLNRTRFGFDLKASGMSPSAASASGVNARAMVVKTMLLSGAVAGLIGLPDLLGNTHSYTTDFTAGLGFLGIAVALLGRNRPLGIAFAALLFGFLDRSLVPLQIQDYPSSVVTIVQGTIVLAVVVANEIARRVTRRSAERGSAPPVGGIVAGDGGTGEGQSVEDDGAVVGGTGAGVSRTAGAGQVDTDGRGGRS